MSKFHLIHCIPNPRMHGLNGYNEVIETLFWGFEQLGHQVSYAVNKFNHDSTNIVFGAQVMSLDALKMLPDDSIIYNFEQMRGLTPDQVKPQIRYCATRFKIWDYSIANLDTWRSLDKLDVHIVPVGYAPVLSRIPKVHDQDIDVLLYGMSGRNRLNVFNEISRYGLTVVFLSGLYGTSRDNLIARSKLVLNVNLYGWAKIFEVVRVSYLFANRKAVISDLSPGTFVEEDIRDSVRFSSLKDMLTSCCELLGDNAKRTALEDSGFAAISKRDIRKILEIPLQK